MKPKAFYRSGMRYLAAFALLAGVLNIAHAATSMQAIGQATAPAKSVATSSVTYTNRKYGFRFVLPSSWKGFSIITGQWTGTPVNGSSSAKADHGLELSIRHPLWTKANPRQDIPIMTFTLKQWKFVSQETLAVSAAPFGPSELGRNSRYVFALPPRYNYAYPEGYEEVEKIIAAHSLHPF
jgi:hypothetical protein